MKRTKKILAICGSTRENSSNTRILRAAAAMVANQVDIELFSGIKDLPFFDPAVPDNERPLVVLEFIRKITEADGILICTPEYVFSLPGVLKNALEWTVSTTAFSYKPVAFIVASASGEKAYESLDLILRTIVQEPIPDDQKLLIKGGQAQINDEDQFVDPKVKVSVRDLVLRLVARLQD